MTQRTIGQINTSRAGVNRGNITPSGSPTGSRKDGFSQALPAGQLSSSSPSSSSWAMPQLANFQLGDRAAKPLTYNSSFGLPGHIDRRQSAMSVASSGSDLLDSFHSDGSKRKVQALFKATSRAPISVSCDELPSANDAAKPSAKNTSPSADEQASADALVRIVNGVDALSNPTPHTPQMDNTANNTKASTTGASNPGDPKTSRDAAVDRLSRIVKGDRLSIERGRHRS